MIKKFMRVSFLALTLSSPFFPSISDAMTDEVEIELLRFYVTGMTPAQRVICDKVSKLRAQEKAITDPINAENQRRRAIAQPLLDQINFLKEDSLASDLAKFQDEKSTRLSIIRKKYRKEKQALRKKKEAHFQSLNQTVQTEIEHLTLRQQELLVTYYDDAEEASCCTGGRYENPFDPDTRKNIRLILTSMLPHEGHESRMHQNDQELEAVTQKLNQLRTETGLSVFDEQQQQAKQRHDDEIKPIRDRDSALHWAVHEYLSAHLDGIIFPTYTQALEDQDHKLHRIQTKLEALLTSQLGEFLSIPQPASQTDPSEQPDLAQLQETARQLRESDAYAAAKRALTPQLRQVTRTALGIPISDTAAAAE